MSRPKVLFLGGGRRVELAKRFWAHGCEVVGYEASADCPLAHEGEVVVGLPWKHPDFAFHLRDAVDAYGISAIIPLQDEAVVTLAGATLLDLDRAGRRVVSPYKAAKLAFDKRKFADFCQSYCDDLYPSPVSGLAAVVKPRFGFGSRDVSLLENYDSGLAFGDSFVAQEALPGPEFTVDSYWTPGGRFVGACPRERLRVAGGEVLDSVVVDRPDLIEASRRLGDAMGLRGPACFQFRYDRQGRPKVLECNARFGGGSTLSCEAGLDMVNYVVKDYVLGGAGYSLELAIEYGLRMTRSYRDHYFRGGK